MARKIHVTGEELHCGQISLFAGEHILLMFQETHQGVWDPVRARIRKEGSRLRHHDLGYLVYALPDIIVDHCFPVLEVDCGRLHRMGQEVLSAPGPGLDARIHHVKNELLLLRRGKRGSGKGQKGLKGRKGPKARAREGERGFSEN